MNLLEIRTKFRDLSGRYDLVNDDFSNNGADFFINEGSKWLDKTVETPKSWASFMKILTIGDWNVQFSLARAIKEVWLTTADGKWQLEKKRLQDLVTGYYTDIPAERVSGTPLYYSPALTRNLPTTLTPAELVAISNYTSLITSSGNDYNAVIFSTPVDKETLVEVIGLFYSTILSLDTDVNYWSTVHPLLLIQAAIRQTYIVGGNKPMLDVLDRGIDGELTRIGYDTVEQMIAEIDQMEG